MSKNKLVIYGSIILVFLIFWSLFFSLLTKATAESVGRSLQTDLETTQSKINRNLETQARDLIAEFDEQIRSAQVPVELNHMLPLLETMQSSHPGRSYYIMDTTGILTSSAGTQYTGFDAETIKRAQRDGFVAASASHFTSSQESVALVIPVNSELNYFLVQIQSLSEFADSIYQQIAFATEHLAIFNEWGTQIHVTTPVAEQGGSNYKTAQAVQYGIQNPNEQWQNFSVQRHSNSGFRFYVALNQPANWIVGGYTLSSSIVPVNKNVFQIAVLAFIAWLLMLAAVITLDIYNDREKKREYHQMDRIDSLTNLSNSVGMQIALENFSLRHHLPSYSFVCLDVVAFHRFNTMFGHERGDTLLRVIGEVLRTRYPCCARMSGDLFAFLTKTSDNIAFELEQDLCGAIESKMGKQYLQMVYFKFGIYPILDSQHRFREIYDNALLALKDAKRSLQANHVTYGVEIQKNVDMQKNIEINMLHALSGEEFLIYIQPKYHSQTQKCAGGEALIRWQSGTMGYLSPDQFIPIFESNGFIVEIDFYMLEQTLIQLQTWLENGVTPFPISVNQSRITINFPNYIERLTSLVHKYPQPLQYVEIEVTESALESNFETMVPLLHSIKKLGFSVSMDDFGTGYSSLNTLRTLPVDVLKIDKGFLHATDDSERSRKIIRNIIHMSKELEISVVCEGVETADQMEFLQEAGCDLLQGYYLARPMPMADFEKYYIKKEPKIFLA